MLDVLANSVKPIDSFKVICEVINATDLLIANLDKNKFRDSQSRDKIIDHIIELIEQEKEGTDG